MKKVQRAVVGGYVKADIDGLGNFLVGRITRVDDRIKKVEFATASGEKIVVPRSELFSATEKEYKATPVAEAAPVDENDAIEREAEMDDDYDVLGDKMADKLRRARSRYAKSRTVKGRPTAHNGDRVARMLEGKSLEEVRTIAADQMRIPHNAFDKWAHLNPGHQRMLIGIALRNHLRDEGQQI